MKKVVSMCLISMLLLFAACDAGDDEPAAPAAEATATPVAVATEVVTSTEEMTDTMDVTDTLDMTDTMGITDTMDMTGTQGMTGTEGTVGSAGIEEAPRHLMRASDIQGFNVENPEGESLGSVEDVVFNLDDGQILLVTLEYGGFLDIGDKVFPVPLSAFRFDQETADIPAAAPAAPGSVVTDTAGLTDTANAGVVDSMVVDTRLILDIPEETFNDAPGFDDDFPVLTDPTNIGDIETFYRDLGEDVIGRPIADTDLDALTGRVVKLSDLEGINVQNPEGEGVGEINDILINLRAGKVEYLLLSFGGFLGIGEDHYAIPVDAFEVIPTSAEIEEGSPVLVLDITEEQLEEAPVFDETTLGIPDWDLDSRDFWLNRNNR
jgi:sporulation protein YlmC with PRC-barrel domain